ncbi:MAG: acylglycerol lipase [Streblomastix strix]|uniref:Acylglycerol lipase n=1 Tax=Streblomastix strix TaxID=222440 RepID=A0A5J4WLS7_9EUKA|nr:MAG: acylglycerol lipase [Streblomastix strix]
MGHSLGGTIGIFITRRVKDLLKGSIFSAPTVYINMPGFMLSTLKIANYLLWWLPFVPFDKNSLSHDPEVVQRATLDNFNTQRKLTLGTAMQNQKACEQIQRFASEDDYPFVILHGTEDKLITAPFNNTEIFFERAPSQDQEKMIIEGAFHEMHNEPQYKEA